MNKLLKMSFDRMGYTYEFLKDINTSKYNGHFLFKDEDKLIILLQKAFRKKKHIVILPDFDMDGISAGAILYAGLSLLMFNVDIYAPDTRNGYGFAAEDIDDILDQWPDTDIILTCDVGITCNDAISYAKCKGLSVFVTDHHVENANRVNADVIVDPSRFDETCNFKQVCGAFIAYHVVRLYAELIDNEAIRKLISHLSLFASLGSMGDLMAVQYDTREVIIDGLNEFNSLLELDLNEYFGCDISLLPEAYINPFRNLKSFHFVLMNKGIIQPGKVTETTYGFTYCPMFNSVKRMEADIRVLYCFLYETFEDKSEDFEKLALWLVDLNVQRKELVKKYSDSLIENKDLQNYAPYVFVTDARAGILGLLAMKMMTVTLRPVMVVNDCQDCYCGSGRLPEWFNASLLNADYICIQGHTHAFGISVQKDHILDFLKLLDDAVLKSLSEIEESGEEIVNPYLSLGLNDPDSYAICDYSITTNKDYDVCYDYAFEKNKFGPYGKGFPEPKFDLYFRKKDVQGIRMMKDVHVRIELDHGITIVFFNCGTRCYEMIKQANEDVVFGFEGCLDINTFRGSTSLQFIADQQLC